MGAVIGDERPAWRIQDTVPRAHGTVIKAAVPLAEMLKYSSALNSLDGGTRDLFHGFLDVRGGARELAARDSREQKQAKAAAPAH